MPSWMSQSHSRTFSKKLLLSEVERDDWWRPGDWEHEVTFAIELSTAKLTRYKGERDGADDWKKAFPADEYLTGTLDAMSMRPGYVPVVDDLKTGAWPVNEKTSKQLRSYALVVWILDGMRLDFEIIVTITQWPKYPVAGKPSRRPHRLTGLDLMEHLEDLRWAVAHPDEVNPTDDGCRFCNSRPLCPAWRTEDN